MRYRVIALFSAVFSVLAAFCIAAVAEEAKSDVKGLFLLTDYPAVTLRPGTTSSINLKLQNYGLPPERLALSVGGVPSGWTATLIGGGQEASIPVILTNSGTAPAEQIELSGTVPPGWKVNFEPKTVDRIAPNENKEVKALVTPSDKAVAGDYVTSVRAAARGESASQTFRVAVTTSTIWGLVGIALIGGALLVMIGAVVWFGRR